ncbi:peptide chain release factor N(5)-glutamine methyltransferase [Chitinophaga sp. GCM10012297]|uniref:Release factor glutamine methyltransferase n=1 Tax=Chitinophaga chungangae TaxID=2821488 RepID=A0ABS3Y9L4_9BACT|nr:peptide chain release factor N(5)-glutamine methyltransferase [Chitinophaga chungangae]MBO9151180.1 peptide chain release factor N(5)-glutamine methyltransferase [Chitinophaga chungangae]
MTIQSAFAGVTAAIRHLYDAREAANIGHLLMEHITGLGKLDRIVHKDGDLTPAQENLYQQALADLLAHKPIQHITGKSWFYGLELQVSDQVLIPRPETEELVEWILKDHPSQPAWRLLDIGTGSGCIPIALKKHWPAADVWAMDVSPGAVSLATRNASAQHTPIRFVTQDVLSADASQVLPSLNIVISNPPYIPEQERAEMQPLVTEFEPSLALFVPDKDPLLFYRRIAQLAQEKLEPGGKLYFEIHESFGKAVIDLLEKEKFREVALRQDMFGKDRMIKAVKK